MEDELIKLLDSIGAKPKEKKKKGRFDFLFEDDEAPEQEISTITPLAPGIEQVAPESDPDAPIVTEGSVIPFSPEAIFNQEGKRIDAQNIAGPLDDISPALSRIDLSKNENDAPRLSVNDILGGDPLKPFLPPEEKPDDYDPNAIALTPQEIDNNRNPLPDLFSEEYPETTVEGPVTGGTKFFDSETFESKAIDTASMTRFLDDTSKSLFSEKYGKIVGYGDLSPEDQLRVRETFSERYIDEGSLDKYLEENQLDIDKGKFAQVVSAFSKGALDVLSDADDGMKRLAMAPFIASKAKSEKEREAMFNTLDVLLNNPEIGLPVSKNIAKIFSREITTNPKYKSDFLLNSLPSGAGSAGAFVLASAIPGAQVAGPGVLGAMSNGESQYQRAKAKDATADQRFAAYFTGAGIGASEALGVGGFLGRLNKASGGTVSTSFEKMLKSSLKEGAEEAAQEFATDVANNLSAQQIFDATQELVTDESIESAAVGGVLGLFLGGIGGAMQAKQANSKSEELLKKETIKILESYDIPSETNTDQSTASSEETDAIDKVESIQPETKVDEQVKKEEVAEPETTEEAITEGREEVETIPEAAPEVATKEDIETTEINEKETKEDETPSPVKVEEETVQQKPENAIETKVEQEPVDPTTETKDDAIEEVGDGFDVARKSEPEVTPYRGLTFRKERSRDGETIRATRIMKSGNEQRYERGKDGNVYQVIGDKKKKVGLTIAKAFNQRLPVGEKSGLAKELESQLKDEGISLTEKDLNVDVAGLSEDQLAFKINSLQEILEDYEEDPRNTGRQEELNNGKKIANLIERIKNPPKDVQIDSTPEQIDDRVSNSYESSRRLAKQAGLNDSDLDILVDAVTNKKERTSKGDKILASNEGQKALEKKNSLFRDYVGLESSKQKKDKDNSKKRAAISTRTGKKLRESGSMDRIIDTRKRNKKKISGVGKGSINSSIRSKFREMGPDATTDEIIDVFNTAIKKHPSIKKQVDSIADEIESEITSEEANLFGYSSKRKLAEAVASVTVFSPKKNLSGEFSDSLNKNKVEHFAVSEHKRILGEVDGPVFDYGELYMPQVQKKYEKIGGTALAPTGSRRIPLDPIPGQVPKKSRNIVISLSKGIPFRIRFSKPQRRKSFGSFRKLSNIANIRYQGDLNTLSHELGHGIDNSYSIIADAMSDIDVFLELIPFSRHGSPVPAGTVDIDRYLAEEGFAEWIRAYVVNPSAAIEQAPNVYSLYKSKVPASTQKAVDQFSTDLRILHGSPLKEQAKAHIHQMDGKDPEPNGYGLFDWRDRFSTVWLDAMWPAFKSFTEASKVKGINRNDPSKLTPSKDFKILARNHLGFNGRVGELLEVGLDDSNGNVYKDKGENINIEWLINQFDNSDTKTIRDEVGDASSLMIAQRTVELSKRLEREDIISGIGAGIFKDIDVANGIVEDHAKLESENPHKFNRINESIRRYRKYANILLKYQVDNGRLSKAAYDEIIKSNAEYVALKRLVEERPGDELNPGLGNPYNITGVKSLVRSIKGSTKTIRDPYESIIEMTYQTYKETERNMVLQSFIEMVKPEAGLIISPEINPFAENVTIIDEGGIPRKGSSDKNVVTVFIDGSPQFWRVEPEVHRALTKMYSYGSEVPKAFRVLSNILKFTITRSPAFATRNFLRDTQQRLVNTNVGSDPRDIITTKDEWALFRRHGGSLGGYYVKDRSTYYNTLDEKIRETAKSGKLVGKPLKAKLKKVWNSYEKKLEISENINRVAEYKAAYRKAKKSGLADYDAKIYAAYHARDLMDFAVGGEMAIYLNKFVPFFNPAIRGIARKGEKISKDIRKTKDKFGISVPADTLARWSIYALAPTLAIKLLNYMMGNDDEYDQLPSWQRDLFYMVKIGDRWLSIPKSHEDGVMAGAADRYIDYISGKKNAFDGYTGSVTKSLIPVDQTALVGPFSPFIEAGFNYDPFRGKHIVPPSQEQIGRGVKNSRGELIRKEGSSSRLSKAAAITLDMIGADVDTRKIDHVIRSQFGYFGEFAIKASNIGDSDLRQFDLTDTGVFRNSPAYNSRDVQWMVEKAKTFNLSRTKDYEEMSHLIGKYFDAPEKEKDAQAKILWEYAKDMRAIWEKERPWER